MDYIGTRLKCRNAIAKINAACGLPNKSATTWAVEQETATAGVYAFRKPEGRWGMSQEEMIAGVNSSLEEVEKAEYPQTEEG